MKDDAERTFPLKPKHQLASIVFSDPGKVSQNVEDLPRTQKERELSIGLKFVRSLKHFLGIELEDIQPDEGQADFAARLASGERVLIQVARVVDQSMRRINERRTSYVERIAAEHPELVRKFGGCRLSIIDSGSEPLLPHVDTSQGAAALSEIAVKLDHLADDVESLETGKIRYRKHKIGDDRVDIAFMCERGAAPESDLPAQLSWTGGYVPDPVYRTLLLADGIRAKIAQGYSRPGEDYWLLIYSSELIPHPGDTEVAEAQTLLDRTDQPFDQVWFLFPYANQDLGHLVKIWPR